MWKFRIQMTLRIKNLIFRVKIIVIAESFQNEPELATRCITIRLKENGLYETPWNVSACFFVNNYN